MTRTRTVASVARLELQDAIRNKWLWAMTMGFGLLATALTLVGVDGARTVGAGGFGRTASSLVALAQMMVPLLGLTLGASAIGTARENGSMRFLLTHPVRRTDVLRGIGIGLIAACWAAMLAGFGIAALVSTATGTPVPAGVVVALTALSALLATAMAAVGIAIGASTRRGSTALGVAVFAWLLLVFIGDLGLMGSALAVRLPVGALFFSVVANPVEAYRLLAVPLFAGSLDVLGPAGTYAIDTLGAATAPLGVAVLIAWTWLPARFATRQFERTDF